MHICSAPIFFLMYISTIILHVKWFHKYFAQIHSAWPDDIDKRNKWVHRDIYTQIKDLNWFELIRTLRSRENNAIESICSI